MKGYRMKALKNNVLRRTFEPEREAITGGRKHSQ
jgi:hypothetical protein